ncbi:hypothetical protein D9M71_775840 [compost metagenome]
MRIVAVNEVQVGVTAANGNGAHQHFARSWLADADFFNGQWRTGGMEYGSFHVVILLFWKQASMAGPRHAGSSSALDH